MSYKALWNNTAVLQQQQKHLNPITWLMGTLFWKGSHFK